MGRAPQGMEHFRGKVYGPDIVVGQGPSPPSTPPPRVTPGGPRRDDVAHAAGFALEKIADRHTDLPEGEDAAGHHGLLD